MNTKSTRKITVFGILLILMLAIVIFASCSNSDNKSTEFPKSNITASDAWSFVEAGYKKTEAATGYDVSYKTNSKAVFAEHSTVESSEHSISIYGKGTKDFTADAKVEYSDTPSVTHYYFDGEKYYKATKENDKFTTPYLYITDDIDVLQEVTGLNVFEINIDKVKVALEGSNSIVKGEENGLQFIKFAITTQSASEILGDTYHVFDGMSDFSGFMFFYIDSDGYLAKFGYESSFSEKSGEEKASVDATCEYTFSNINKTEKILAPGWVSKLQPEEIDTVYYIKDKVSYAFIYEESESTNGYGYKFYWVESTEDVDKPVAFADVPSKINGVDVTDISRTILIFGKGAEVMVLPETINYLPYAQEDVKATIFSKCDKFSEDVPEGITAYTAGEWEYVNGVPTVKGK